ncbi:metalloprotease [Coemansia sp. RSA 1365]|nr:metalloprotease [Coemansia sp. RSA 1365]
MNPFDAKQLPDWEAGFEPRITAESRISYEEYTGTLEKLAEDTRQYRLLRLPNNMVALCISEPNSKTAAAALTVGVGSHADPDDALGLANLLGHMLLMESAEYPRHSSFEDFLQNHSGSSEVSTSTYKTCYYFDIYSDFLDGALDRMSGFFMNPIISPEVIDCAVDAVNSEDEWQLTNENARIDGFKAFFSNPNHPHLQFATGNSTTLNRFNPEELSKKVVEFYNHYYSADIMKLVLIADLSLDDLTEMAVTRPTDVCSVQDEYVPTLLKYENGLELCTAVNVTVEGFSLKLPVLIERVISNMRQVVIKESIFNDCLKKVQKSISCSKLLSAATQSSSCGIQLLLYPTWDTTQLEESLKDVTYDMLNNFVHALFEQVHIKMLVTGVFTEQHAIDIAHKVQNIIKAESLPNCQIPYVRLVQLDPGYYILPKLSLNDKTAKNGVIANIQLGRSYNVRERMIATVFNELFKTHFSDQLDIEELGFNIDSSIESYPDGNQILKLRVEEESNPIYLSLRITKFLHTYRQELVDFNINKLFDIIKEIELSFQQKLESRIRKLPRMQNAIDTGEYNFNKLKEEITCLKTIGKQDIIDMWDTFINSDTAPQYTRTDIHIWSSSTQLPSSAELEKYTAGVLALQRLVKGITDYDIDLDKLDSFIKAESMDGSQDNVYEKLVPLCPVLQDLPLKIPTEDSDEDRRKSCKNICCWKPNPKVEDIKIGLQMALESAVNAPDYHKHSSIDFSTIGMCQTIEGIWIIDDIPKFQSTQMLNGSLIPAIKLIPKYEN